MTKIFIFACFALNVFHSFLFYILLPWKTFREISLAVMLRQNSKTNMTKNRDIPE